MSRRKITFFVAVFLVIGIIISISLFEFINQSLDDLKTANFINSAEERYNVLQESINHNSIIMFTLRNYFESSDYITQQDFSNFTKDLLEFLPGVVALEYAPKISNDQRDYFEKNALEMGYVEFKIKDYVDGEIAPLEENEIYYPIYYIYPSNDFNKKALGLNIYSDNLSKTEIEWSRITNSHILSKPVELLGDSSNKYSYSLLLTTKNGAHEEGVLLSIIKFYEMFSNSMLSFNDKSIDVIALDTTDKNNSYLIFHYLSEFNSISNYKIDISTNEIKEPLYLKKNLYFGNRKWTLYFIPTDLFSTYEIFRFDYFILSMSLMIILISAYYFYSLLNRNNKLEMIISEKTKELEDQAIRDSLTGLYNRRKLFQEIIHFVNRYNRQNEPFSLSMIDLDFFKKVNDDYGHDVGDFILVSFATYMKDKIRENDLFIRYGGEEFVIIFENINRFGAMKILNRALEDLNKEIFTSRGFDIKISFSAGISDVTESIDIYKLIKISDNRMYVAKENGRNQIIAK